MIVSKLQQRLSVEILPVYFLKGHDIFLRDWAIKILSVLTDANFADFNISTYEDATDMKDVITVLNTVPVFAARRIVIVKSADNLDDGDKSRLENYLKNPADFSLLVFVDDIISAEDSDKKESPLHYLYKYGEIVDCNNIDSSQYNELIDKYATAKGAKIDYKAIALLGQFTNLNMTRSVIELNKLFAYAEGQTVTNEDVYLLVSSDNDFKTYALTNAITKSNNDLALSILQSLLDKGESPSSLLSLITAQYRRMLEAKISKLDANALAKALGVRVGSINIAKELAAAYTPMELKKIVEKLHDLEFSFKSGKTDELSALHNAFATLIQKR